MLKRRRINQRFHAFDEVVVDASVSNCDLLERPLNFQIFWVIMIAVVFSALAITFQIFNLNVKNGGFYSARAAANVNQEIKTPAPRGLITDRFGTPLLENQPAFSIVLNIINLMRMTDDEYNHVIDSLNSIIGIDSDLLRNRLNNLDLKKTSEIVVAKDISLESALALKNIHSDAIVVVDDYRRHYIYGPVVSHVLGYIGESNQEDLLNNPSLDFGDYIGKQGLELYYDDLLRGQKGKIINSRDAFSNVIETRRSGEPIAGSTLKLTLDLELQKVMYESLSQTLANLERNSGVGLAINPQNGEMLAAVSFPSFDNNVFIERDKSQERLSLLSDPNLPLFNRFTAGVYSPGSTIKPLVALAALAEGVVDDSDIFFSKGYLDVPNPYFPDQPSRFLDWKSHGWVDVYSSLARSSNIYYYYVGGGFDNFQGLGISRLKEWWQRFGLENKTGLDLPGEKIGNLPDPETKQEAINDAWRLGDTYNVAIGQGDLMITPLELLNYISAIANNGLAYKPHLLQSAFDENPIIDVSEFEDEIQIVKRGLADAVDKEYGTAHTLNHLPVSIGAKTGSAQVSNNLKTNAFIVAYAPSDNPSLAILIMVEDAREGSLNVVPVANEVLSWYYHNRLSADSESSKD